MLEKRHDYAVGKYQAGKEIHQANRTQPLDWNAALITELRIRQTQFFLIPIRPCNITKRYIIRILIRKNGGFPTSTSRVLRKSRV